MISGCVLRARDGMPVAAVTVLHRAAGGSNETSAVTDRRGRFALCGAKASDGDAGVIVVNDPLYAVVKQQLGTGYSGQEIVIYLYDPAVIYGSVRDADGAPIANALVTVREYGRDVLSGALRSSASVKDQDLYYAWQEFSTTSDALGMYALSNMVAPGKYTLQAGTADMQMPLCENASSVTVATEPCQSHRCDLVLYPRPVIMVKVEDAHGAAVRQYDLSVDMLRRTSFLEERHSAACAVSLTNCEWYAVPVTEQMFCVPVRLQVTTADGRKASAVFAVYANQPRNEVMLRLERPTVLVSGCVMTAAGVPCARAQINARHTITRAYTDVTADDAGNFVVTDLPAERGENIQLRCMAAQTHVPCGTRDMEWRLDANQTSVMYTVRGRVCYADGTAPASTFAVRTRYDYCTAEKAADGGFSLSTHDATGVVMVSSAGFADVQRAYVADASRSCDVGTLVLSSACARVHGRLMDSTGKPMAIWVVLESDNQDVHVEAMSRAYDGGYEFVELNPDAYAVKVYIPGSGIVAKIDFTVAAGEEKTLPDLVVNVPRDEQVTVRLLLPDGQPARYAFIELELLTTDERGEVCGYFADTAIWNVQCANKSYVTPAFRVPAGASFTQIVLRPADVMAGRVYLDGRPLYRPWLILRRDGLIYCYAGGIFENYFSLTGEEGEYDITEQRTKST
ncbi:MAG: carboxypeptidase-like regulatory domain-containing protein, partial [bacterium]|nr:carboxypeptidase-like regulatory domain-containing protein [bacterium]